MYNVWIISEWALKNWNLLYVQKYSEIQRLRKIFAAYMIVEGLNSLVYTELLQMKKEKMNNPK